MEYFTCKNYKVYYQQTPVTDYKRSGDEIILLCNNLIEETVQLGEIYSLLEEGKYVTFILESGEDILPKVVDHINKKVEFQKREESTEEVIIREKIEEVVFLEDTSYYKGLEGWTTAITL